MDLVEFTADAPGADDIDSFLEFIGGLSDRKLTYYLLGRMCTMEQIPQHVSDGDELPMEIPAGQPYKLIQFVPSCLTSYRHNYLFGYGKIIVIFSCEKSLKEADDSRQLAENTLNTLKALSDKNRLRLLRLI